MTESRIRGQPDQGRMADLVRSPGIDSRSWVHLARIDDDPDAIRWAAVGSEDGAMGWLVDVTVQGGEQDQESVDGCQVSSAFGGKSDPPKRGCLVLLTIPEGNTNAQPIITGFVNTGDCPPPTEVNGTEINEAYALATHILVTDKAVDQQVAGDVRVKSGGTLKALGENVALADEGATQPFVRGTDYASALNSFAQSVQSAFTQLGPGAPPTTPVTQAQVTLAVAAITTAVATLATDLQTSLSERIKGV